VLSKNQLGSAAPSTKCGFLTIIGECYGFLPPDRFEAFGERLLDALVGDTAERKP
jgi:hypothetical protein